MSTQLEHLRSWGHILFWASVILPTMGVMAGVVRFYIDRREKTIVSAIMKVELENSQHELESLKLETAPRHLPEEQRAAIEAALKHVPSGAVTIVSGFMDDECNGYAEELCAVFVSSGWNVSRNRTSLNDFRGLAIGTVGSNGNAELINAIVDALHAGGIAITKQEIRPNSVVGPLQNGVAIYIGKR